MHRLAKWFSIFKFALRRVLGHIGYVLGSGLLAMTTVACLVLVLSLTAMITNLPIALPFVSSATIDPEGSPATTDVSPNGFLIVSGILALAIYGAILQSLAETTPSTQTSTANRYAENLTSHQK